MWGLHIGLLGALFAYVCYQTPTSRAKYKTWIGRWGPCLVLAVGSLMVIFDLTRHVLLDQGLFPKTLAMFSASGGLSTMGVFGVIMTWSGLCIVVLSMAWFVGYLA
mmetsp:Transcript_56942/g.133755  ORF Transcript_56942/g.133755 Transcript_56942/m.133755 type:complete len:106 (-) Transcript_56942:230-547(-)